MVFDCLELLFSIQSRIYLFLSLKVSSACMTSGSRSVLMICKQVVKVVVFRLSQVKGTAENSYQTIPNSKKKLESYSTLNLLVAISEIHQTNSI